MVIHMQLGPFLTTNPNICYLAYPIDSCLEKEIHKDKGLARGILFISA